MARFVKNYYPEYDSSWVHGCDPWVGLRPLSADGIPYIGSFNKFPNLIAATGHAMMGISMAPVTGEIVNNLILGKKPNFNLDMLSPDRF
jgi:D-amino-acid dehydrogenase